MENNDITNLMKELRKSVDNFENKIIDITIENFFAGATLDKGFYRNEGFHKLTLVFNGLRIHIKLNDTNLKRFKASIMYL